MIRLTPGKYLGLSRISRNGFLTITALDHRGSFKKLANPTNPGVVTLEQVAAMKRKMISVLSPESSALLLDPEYILFPAIYANLLSGTGLLVSLEKTGYGENKRGRTTSVLPKWGVRKIRRMGADGVKLLLFYNPEYRSSARAGERLVRRVAKECRKEDILFLLEPMSYSLGEPKDSKGFADRKPEIVIKTAETLSRLGIDVLKSEFPVDLRFNDNQDSALAVARQLDAATITPWVILSEGVTYPTFRTQVELACRAGASGFLAGRALWQEALLSSDMEGFLRNESLARLREISNYARSFGKPWTGRVEVPHDAQTSFKNYYRKY